MWWCNLGNKTLVLEFLALPQGNLTTLHDQGLWSCHVRGVAACDALVLTCHTAQYGRTVPSPNREIEPRHWATPEHVTRRSSSLWTMILVEGMVPSYCDRENFISTWRNYASDHGRHCLTRTTRTEGLTTRYRCELSRSRRMATNTQVLARSLLSSCFQRMVKIGDEVNEWFQLCGSATFPTWFTCMQEIRTHPCRSNQNNDFSNIVTIIGMDQAWVQQEDILKQIH